MSFNAKAEYTQIDGTASNIITASTTPILVLGIWFGNRSGSDENIELSHIPSASSGFDTYRIFSDKELVDDDDYLWDTPLYLEASDDLQALIGDGSGSMDVRVSYYESDQFTNLNHATTSIDSTTARDIIGTSVGDCAVDYIIVRNTDSSNIVKVTFYADVDGTGSNPADTLLLAVPISPLQTIVLTPKLIVPSAGTLRVSTDEAGTGAFIHTYYKTE